MCYTSIYYGIFYDMFYDSFKIVLHKRDHKTLFLDQDTFNQAGIQTHLLPLHQAHSYKDYTCGLVSPAYPHSCLMDVDININILSILKSMAI